MFGEKPAKCKDSIGGSFAKSLHVKTVGSWVTRSQSGYQFCPETLQ